MQQKLYFDNYALNSEAQTDLHATNSTNILIKPHTCSVEYNKKLWSPPQTILLTMYFFDSDEEKKRETAHVSWLILYNS